MANPTPADLFDPGQLNDAMVDLLTTGITDLAAAAKSGDTSRCRAAERAWAAAAVDALEVSIAVTGTDRVDPKSRYLVVSLHEGFADVLALQTLPLELTWVIRDELLEMPYFGEYLRLAGHIPVEPEQPRSALRRLLRAAPAAFERGGSLVVFPQGSVLGIETAFQSGAFRLAERWGVPVLPVVLSGAHKVWEYPFSPTVRLGQRIQMEVLDPIPPESAVAAMRPLERTMKERALAATDAGVNSVTARDRGTMA